MASLKIHRKTKIALKIRMSENDARSLADSLREARHLPGITVSSAGFGWMHKLENALNTVLKPEVIP
jgi:hypothetical protein